VCGSFDLRNGNVLERDEFGLDLPDFESAYLEAHRAAIDIWSEARREGGKPAYRCFEIRDSSGRIVTELPFDEALNGPSKIAPLEPIKSERPRDVVDQPLDVSQWRPHWLTDELAKTELAHVEAGITSGERHIANQRERIARLEAKGYDVAFARTLLETFLETQSLHEHHRGILKRELAAPR
jgi:hypothetical protein